MAAGKAIGRFEAALGVVGILALATTYVLITGWNPVPGFLDWVGRAGSLSSPETSWKTRTGGKPDYTVVADDAIVVVMRGAVEARDTRDGAKLWSREVPWASVAGADSSTVVVAGRAGGRGFDAVEPSSGATRWSDDQATAVWTYRDAVLVLTCQGLSDCTLAGRAPSGGQVRWRTPLPGIGKVLAGVNHELPGSSLLKASTVDSRVGSPVDVPPVLGFPLGGKVQVVDTGTGKRIREVDSGGTTRVVVVGGRILRSTAERREGHCRYALEALDPGNGRLVWRKEGYDLRTASGAGCEQRRDPSGGGGALAAIRGDNREVLLNAADGRELWVGGPGERALATDGLVVLVRSGNAVKAVDLGDRRTMWERQAEGDVEAAVTRYGALVIEDGRVRAIEVGTGRTVIDAQTTARVVGAGSDGVVLGTGRTIGFLPFGSIADTG